MHGLFAGGDLFSGHLKALCQVSQVQADNRKGHWFQGVQGWV